eukprot:4508285-Prymnesium_polylepis.1
MLAMRRQTGHVNSPSSSACPSGRSEAKQRSRQRRCTCHTSRGASGRDMRPAPWRRERSRDPPQVRERRCDPPQGQESGSGPRPRGVSASQRAREQRALEGWAREHGR